MIEKAKMIIYDYVKDHLDKSGEVPIFEVYIVWQCKALKNWKFLLSTTLSDGMYYELTYNGENKEWYLDAYKKFENKCIKGQKDTDEQVEEVWNNFWKDIVCDENGNIDIEQDKKEI